MKPNKNNLQKVFQVLTVGYFGMAVNNTINNANQNKDLRNELADERLNNANLQDKLQNMKDKQIEALENINDKNNAIIENTKDVINSPSESSIFNFDLGISSYQD
jgi:hypothetical protein